MAALAAAMRQKEELAALERSAKQGSRVRLLADRSISAAALQGVLGEYLRHQGSKDLWCFIAPPPTGPTQYGWHTYPHPEWLAKTAPLLYDLVGVAPNTKLQSSKLVISLKALLESNELELKVKKDRTIQDSLDQLDLTIRILLNMTRSLKCSELQRLKCQRCLSRQDWMKVELLLERVQLPPELLAAASFSSVVEEDVPLQTVCVTSNMDILGRDQAEKSLVGVTSLVPNGPVVQQKQRGSSSTRLCALPAVFQRFKDQQDQEPDSEPPRQSQDVGLLRTSSSHKVQSILAAACSYEAKASALPLPRSKQTRRRRIRRAAMARKRQRRAPRRCSSRKKRRKF